MKLEVYNKTGEKSGNVNMPDDVFGVEWDPDLVHHAFVIHRSNHRRGTAKTKERSEVSGGGRKPWRQKGTGRARHGSIRSPLWIGGGVTFGPTTDKKYKKKINKKEKRRALFSLLSKKLDEGEIKVVDSLDLDEYKTRNAKDILESLFEDKKWNALFVLSEGSKKFGLAARNLPGVDCMDPKSLNVSELLSYKYIVFEKDVVSEVVDHFQVNTEREPAKVAK